MPESPTALSDSHRPLVTGTPVTHMLCECPTFTEPVSASEPRLGQTLCLAKHPLISRASTVPAVQRSPGPGSQSHQSCTPGGGSVAGGARPALSALLSPGCQRGASARGSGQQRCRELPGCGAPVGRRGRGLHRGAARVLAGVPRGRGRAAASGSACGERGRGHRRPSRAPLAVGAAVPRGAAGAGRHGARLPPLHPFDVSAAQVPSAPEPAPAPALHA